MSDREWMFDGWASEGHVTKEWLANTQAFMDEAFSKVKGPLPIVWCPCSRCGNTRRLTKSEMENICANLDLLKTIQSGPTIPKLVALETRP